MSEKAPRVLVPRVLVVDDDPELRGLLQRFLSEHGFHVRALDGGKALDQALARDPADVIVLDLMMPGEDGLAICRRLRAQGDTTPILMLTARGDAIDRVLGLEMGADDYLPKPFLPRELVARLHRSCAVWAPSAR
jgi:two-component system phosphate regulon response regulator OmpR